MKIFLIRNKNTGMYLKGLGWDGGGTLEVRKAKTFFTLSGINKFFQAHGWKNQAPDYFEVVSMEIIENPIVESVELIPFEHWGSSITLKAVARL